MAKLLDNWKTTLGGVAAILAGLAAILNGITAGDMEGVGAGAAGVAVGWGLLQAQDAA
jgi:hypothetical protein